MLFSANRLSVVQPWSLIIQNIAAPAKIHIGLHPVPVKRGQVGLRKILAKYANGVATVIAARNQIMCSAEVAEHTVDDEQHRADGEETRH